MTRGRKDLFLLTTCRSHSAFVGSPGRNPRQEPGSRTWNTGHRGVILTGLFLTACSVCFLIEPRTPHPQMVLCTVGWVFPGQSFVKKMPYRCDHKSTWWRRFLNLGSSFQMTLACQVNVIYSSCSRLLFPGGNGSEDFFILKKVVKGCWKNIYNSNNRCWMCLASGLNKP